MKTYAHTLSLRLSAEQYRRLRRHVVGIEEQTGERATHQAVIENALDEYLTRRDDAGAVKPPSKKPAPAAQANVVKQKKTRVRKPETPQQKARRRAREEGYRARSTP